MIKKLQKRYAMSEKGAGDLFRGIVWTTLLNLSFMLPIIVICMFIDSYIGEGTVAQDTGLLFYLGLSIATAVVIAVISVFQYDSTYTTIYEESAKTRISLAEKLRKLPLAFFGKKDLSDLSATIMDDATQIESLFSHSVPQVYASIISVGIMAVLLIIYNWLMAVALLWVVPVSALILMISSKKQRKAHEEFYLEKRKIADIIQEDLDSISEIKSYNREEEFADEIDAVMEDLRKNMVNVELLIAIFMNFAYFPLKLGLPSVLLAGGYMVYEGEVTMFTYIVFLIVASRIYNPIIDTMNNFALLKYLRIRINRIKEMNDMPIQGGEKQFSTENYDIEFKNVGFSYDEDLETLEDINFIAKQGEVTALVGPSGSGKSTIAKLAARFWDVDSGQVTLGGNDISKIDPEVLLQNYSIVFQDVLLFDGSVMENIRLGRKGATDEEVIAAAHAAQCMEFIDQLPKGFDTEIGENGKKLSGGERQRISIARAILKDSPIIVMDEATASLDTENESKIQQALSNLIKNKTVLIIAHRMRTVWGANKIIVVKDGRIAESGSSEELMEKKGVFWRMAQV